MLSDGESQRRRLVPADEITAEERVVRVPCVSLADLAGRWELKQIDLLKMDIEGSEWEVLFSTPAAVLQLIQRIQFEYHEVHARFGYSREKLFAHLQNVGYSITYCREDVHHTGIAIAERR